MSNSAFKDSIVKLALNAPLIGKHLQLYRTYKNIPFAPGHYYSVIPDVDSVEKNQKRIFQNEEILDVDLNLEQQLLLLDQFRQLYTDMPYDFMDHEGNDRKAFRYKMKDAFYRNSDAVMLHLMIRQFKPARIVEVGSGHSSAIMLDTNEHFLQNSAKITFVEPYPEERLLSVLRESDKEVATLMKSFIQDVDPSVYSALEANDMLFIDSSHVSKIDSDVNYVFFNILPKLKPGVLIHFHDIFFPFELPKPWVTGRKWFWNENYLLRAFLMNNKNYEIIMFNDLLHKRYRGWFEQHMPACLIDGENTGSIWLRKIR